MAKSLSTSINLGLPQGPETTDMLLYAELSRIYNAINILAQSIDVYTGGLNPDSTEWSAQNNISTIRTQNILRTYCKANEDIASGALVCFVNGTTELLAVNADATDDTKPARGYCSAGAINAGEFGQFTLGNSLHPSISGLTYGTKYYLSTTPGLITATEPTDPGNLVQVIGFALSPTELFFCPETL